MTRREAILYAASMTAFSLLLAIFSVYCSLHLSPTTHAQQSGICSVSPPTPVFDASQCSAFQLQLGATPVTGSTLINAQSGQQLTFLISQDATGNRPFIPPPNLEHICSVSQTAGVLTIISAIFVGPMGEGTNCTTTDQATLIAGPLRPNPPNPTSGLNCWFGSTISQPGATLKCAGPAADAHSMTATTSAKNRSYMLRYIDPDGVQQFSRFADAETPSGSIDGSNASFALAHSPNPFYGLLLFKGGSLMISGQHYNLNAANVVFTPGNIPQAGESLIAWYRF